MTNGSTVGTRNQRHQGALRRHEPAALVALLLMAIVVSGINPYDRGIWLLEVVPILVTATIVIAMHFRFHWTSLSLRLLFLGALIMLAGAHYAYARVPLGQWIQDVFHLGRNHYDRLGHFAQGFIPAIALRELLIRRTPLHDGGTTFALVVASCLALSALYEIVEWLIMAFAGDRIDLFLGAQGDVWDAQWDMFLALLGAIVAQLFFGRLHNRQISALEKMS